MAEPRPNDPLAEAVPIAARTAARDLRLPAAGVLRADGGLCRFACLQGNALIRQEHDSGIAESRGDTLLGFVFGNALAVLKINQSPHIDARHLGEVFLTDLHEGSSGRALSPGQHRRVLHTQKAVDTFRLRLGHKGVSNILHISFSGQKQVRNLEHTTAGLVAGAEQRTFFRPRTAMTRLTPARRP